MRVSSHRLQELPLTPRHSSSNMKAAPQRELYASRINSHTESLRSQLQALGVDPLGDQPEFDLRKLRRPSLRESANLERTHCDLTDRPSNRSSQSSNSVCSYFLMQSVPKSRSKSVPQSPKKAPKNSKKALPNKSEIQSISN